MIARPLIAADPIAPRDDGWALAERRPLGRSVCNRSAGVEPLQAEVADIGYQMQADVIEPERA